MKLKHLPLKIDRDHEKRSQRNKLWSRHPHTFKVDTQGEINMGVKEMALAKAKKLREQQAGKTAPAKTASKGTKTATAKKSTPRKTDIPYAKVAQMYDAGKSVSEISDSMGWTDKKSNWPYSYTYGILKRLRAGVQIDGKTIKVQPKSKK